MSAAGRIAARVPASGRRVARSHLVDAHPAALLDRPLHGIDCLCDLVAEGEVGLGGAALGDRADQLARLRDLLVCSRGCCPGSGGTRRSPGARARDRWSCSRAPPAGRRGGRAWRNRSCALGEEQGAPELPWISWLRPILRPVPMRLVPIVPIAPVCPSGACAKRRRNCATSSFSTARVSAPPRRARSVRRAGAGERPLPDVRRAHAAHLGDVAEEVLRERERVRAMSPSAPEPATARSWRQVNGNSGSLCRS